MASPPPQPMSLQAAPRLREAAKYLVFNCGLRPDGLEPAQLDLIFLDDHKSQDFVYGYAIIRQLGPASFWALIAELHDERTGNERARLASSATLSQPAAAHTGADPSDHTNIIITPNSDYLDQASPSQKLNKRVVTGRQRKADGRRSDTPSEPEPKRQKQASSTVDNVSRTYPTRECPGSYSQDGEHRPCKRKYSYKGAWETHWAKCHDEHFKLDTPDGKKEYRCIPSCPGSFDRAALLEHQWKEHMKESDTVISSSNTVTCFETTNTHQISSTTNTFPGASVQPPSSFQQDHGNQSQPGPHCVKHDTSDDESNVKFGRYPDVLRETFPNNGNSHGHLHDTPLMQETTLPDASNGTTQVWNGATPASSALNATYDFYIPLFDIPYMGYQTFPRSIPDGDIFDAV